MLALPVQKEAGAMNLDTFLTALYTIVNDLYRQHAAAQLPLRPGQKPTLSGSEALTLALCDQWRGTSGREFLSYAFQNRRPRCRP